MQWSEKKATTLFFLILSLGVFFPREHLMLCLFVIIIAIIIRFYFSFSLSRKLIEESTVFIRGPGFYRYTNKHTQFCFFFPARIHTHIYTYICICNSVEFLLFLILSCSPSCLNKRYHRSFLLFFCGCFYLGASFFPFYYFSIYIIKKKKKNASSRLFIFILFFFLQEKKKQLFSSSFLLCC